MVNLPRKIRGIIFDLDGTLTVPVFDINLLKERLGIPREHDILDVMAQWSPQRRKQARAAIHDIEVDARQRMQIMPGTTDLLHVIDKQQIPRGLITRNVLESVHHFHTTCIPNLPPFYPAIARDTFYVYKPDPRVFYHVCETWGIPPEDCAMVGDSAKDDVLLGRRAGGMTILLDYEEKIKDINDLPEENRPNILVKRLGEMLPLFQR